MLTSRSNHDHDIPPLHTTVVRIHSRGYAIDRMRQMLVVGGFLRGRQQLFAKQSGRKRNTRSIFLSAGVRTRTAELIHEHI